MATLSLRTLTNIVSDLQTAIAIARVPVARRMMFAQLGAVRMEVVGPIGRIQSKRAYTYARHEVIEGKPRLQSTGDELEELTLTLVFHDMISDPATAYADLCAAAAAHEVLPLVFASGQVAGRYVITEIGDAIDAADETGRVIGRSTEVILSEWVESKPLEVASRVRRNAAAAVRAAAPKATARATQKAGAAIRGGDPRAVATCVVIRGSCG